jgi:hypothetical protein
MPQGQFTTADLQQQAPSAGRFTAADIDSTPEQPKSDGFWLDLAHRLVQNNPFAASKNLIGAGGMVQGDEPTEEFKWSDVHPSLRNLVRNTADELKRTFAPNAGTAVGNAITLGQTIRPVAPGTITAAASATRPALANAADFASGALDNSFAGALNPRLPHTGKLLGKAADALRPKAPAAAPALTPAETAEGATWREPDNASAPSVSEESKAQVERPGYPPGLNKRPTDRTEIVSDKAVEDAMRNDLEKQGWRALSQERKEFYANNQPGMAKGDLITNARVEAVRTAAEEQVQKILAESNPPVKYTKTVIPKAKVTTTAQPIAEDLNSPNRLVDLMQQSIDAVNARKGKK